MQQVVHEQFFIANRNEALIALKHDTKRFAQPGTAAMDFYYSEACEINK